jgi:hypothetical protein
VLNILFVMKHRGNAGSTHAIANYMRVAPRYGHSVALYGAPIWYVPELQFSMNIGDFDRVVFLFESELYRIKPLQEVAVLGTFPRTSRLILDADGMYNPMISVEGYDFNHRNEAERAKWIEYLNALGDRIAQPTFLRSDNPRVSAMAFFGYNPAFQIDASSAPPKRYDILHVGHNWWRWRQVANELLPAIEQIRDQVGEIGFIGLWWDRPPAEGLAAGPEEAFFSDPIALRRLRIQTLDAVMYHDVIQTMSTARINILTQRPVLRRLRHLTLKYFEIFCADTIPLLMLDDDHAEAVYGPAARELTLTGKVGDKILDALHHPDHYKGVVADIRRHLIAHYSYEQCVEELVAAVRN